ncbi:hypothetical protein EC957_006878 [Mortierella hygrophila]|uniref:Uncharacterized protein n=1 Tax=Mortierella hygrophila TaxID=979708 RepID=A0A9P6JYD8_9FUNG|nr:hypothetical protein EC957_006878 [Mortierella hygrophila]
MLLIKTVALLCSATAAMAASAVVSGAIFDGYDTTDQSASSIDIFQVPSNHAAATASILVYAGELTHFSPATQEPKSLVQSYNGFISKVSSFPSFQQSSHVDESLFLTGSLSQFEEIISESLEDRKAARALRGLVPDNIQDQSLTEWVLSLIVLSKPEGHDIVSFKLIRVTLIILSDETQAAYIPRQKARIVNREYMVNSAHLSSLASRLAQSIETIVNVDEFIGYFTSPKGPSQDEEIQNGSTSCSQSRPLFKDRQAIMSWLL